MTFNFAVKRGLPKKNLFPPYCITSDKTAPPTRLFARYFSQKAWFLWKEKKIFLSFRIITSFPSILGRICFTNFFGKISFPCAILTLQFLIGFLYVVGRQLTSGLLTWNMSLDLTTEMRTCAIMSLSDMPIRLILPSFLVKSIFIHL